MNFELDTLTSFVHNLVYIPIIDSYAIRVELQYTVELKENVCWEPGTDHRVFYFPFDPKDYE